MTYHLQVVMVVAIGFSSGAFIIGWIAFLIHRSDQKDPVRFYLPGSRVARVHRELVVARIMAQVEAERAKQQASLDKQLESSKH